MAGYTVITGSNLKDISGKPLNGRVTFTGPVNTAGQPLSALAAGGPMLYGTTTFLVVNGVITGDDAHVQNTAQVADTSLTTPENVGYSVSFFASKLTLTPIPRPGYTCVQPSGASWSLDTYVPAQGALTVVTPGPEGPPGQVQFDTLLSATSDVYARLGLAQPQNLFDPTKGSQGYNDTNSFTLNPGGPYWTTGPLLVAGLANIILNVATVSGAAIYWLKSDGTLLSMDGVAKAAATSIPVPSAATSATISLSLYPGGSASRGPTGVMIEAGTVSHAYVPYTLPLPETTNLVRESAAIATGAGALAGFLTAKTGAPFINLYDASKNVLGIIDSNGTIDHGFDPYYLNNTLFVLGLSFVIANFKIGYGTGFSTLFLAADGATVIENRADIVYNPGSNGWTSPIPVPAGTTFMKFFGQVSDIGYLPPYVYPMVLAGSLPSPHFVPYATPQNPMPGKRGFITGDSITGYNGNAWPKKLAGLLNLQQTIGTPNGYGAFAAIGAQRGAYAAGTTYAAGDLVYYTDGLYYTSLVASNTGNTPPNSPAQWANWALTSDVISQPGHPLEDCFLPFDLNADANPSGPTTTQQITAALGNKDFFILAYGTNNYGQALGSFSDAPQDGHGVGASTFYAALWFKINLADAAILATGRTIVPCFLTPYHNSRGTSAALLAQINAIKAVCAERGWVVMDAYSDLAINSVNWSRTLVGESDGAGGTMHLHPTFAGTEMIGNFVARALIRSAQV